MKLHSLIFVLFLCGPFAYGAAKRQLSPKPTSEKLAFSPKDFRNLALELVSDIEKAYGIEYEDRGEFFSVAEYRDLIQHQIVTEPSLKPLENLYYETDQSGRRLLVREKDVAAKNFYPNEKKIIYNVDTFAEKMRKGQRNILKVMIHHEYIPFLIKRSDRKLEFNKKIEEIYNPPLTWQSLEPGLYEVFLADDPIYDALTKFYWYQINISKHSIILEMVENPRANYWCVPCYHVPPEFKIIYNSKTTIIPMSRGRKDMGIYGLSASGIPYIRVISKTSFLFAIADTNDTSNFDEIVNKSDKKGVVFEKVSDFSNLNWRKPKRFIFPSFYSSDKDDCENSKEDFFKKTIETCEWLAKMPASKLDRRSCKRDLYVTITDVTGNPGYENLKCGFASVGDIAAPLDFNPTPNEPLKSEMLIRKWEGYLQRAIEDKAH